MTAAVARAAPAQWLVWPAAAASLGLVAAGTGVVAPLVPMLAVAAFAFILAAPMRWTAAGLLFLALVADNPGERPNEGRWDSPLHPLGSLLYDNLHKLTHIEALRFCALELLIGLLMAIILLRKLYRDPIDDPLALGALPNPMKLGFASFFGAIVFLELYGLARGGDFKNSLWQVRVLFWLPVLGILFGHSFKTEKTRRTLLMVILAAAATRAMMGIYYYFGVCRPAAIRPDYTTTHSDSVLTVVAMLIAVTLLAERPCRDHALLNALVQPLYLVALIVNNRRIAFVHLLVGLMVLVLLGPTSLRRFLRRSALVMVPLLAVYVAVGWNSSAGIFRPIKIINSVSAQKDDSSKTRDIENYNLVQTLKVSPLIGSGFGHEYREIVKANRVDQFFAQYRFIAHNSVLWLLSISGALGFAMVWILLPVAVHVALGVHALATRGIDRTVAFAALASLICFAMQAWGDMGLQSWMTALIVTSLTGATGAMWTAARRQGSIA